MVMADIMYGGAGVAGGVGAAGGAVVGTGTGSVGVGATGLGGDVSEENYTEFYGTVNNTGARPRYPGLYVGNLTWWTTDQDVINAIVSVGVTDLQEVKFFENRNNGQSKGFCVVTFNSEASLPIVMEKLPKIELYGQSPVVTPYNRQNLNLFESQTKTRPQINSNNGPNSHAAGIMGISSISGVHSNTQGLPYTNMNTYQQGGGVGGFGGGPRAPYAPHMRPMMRAPRPQMMMQPQQLPNHIIPGGHRMNHRMRFMQPQAGWAMPQAVGMDLAASRVESKPDGPNDMAPSNRPRMDDSYSSSRSRGEDRDRSRRDDEISSRRESDSRRDDGYSSSSRRGDEGRGSSRRELENSSLGTSSSSRRTGDESSSGRRDERSSRREEKSFRREEKSLRHQSSRPDDRGRSRSRDRSRERKERRERRSERY